MENLKTLGKVAEELGIPLWRAAYLVKTRNIKPEFRAGHFRVFGQTAVDALKAELEKSNER